MEQIRALQDDRWNAYCAYCHRKPLTRDHVPPKVFLDEPFPDNLPVVQCCEECNNGRSLDEEYVACLLAVAESGAADPAKLRRAKVAGILQAKTAMATRLASCLDSEGFNLLPDDAARISAVVAKMGRGLWTFETGESAGLASITTAYTALRMIDPGTLARFMTVDQNGVFPEVGSRMLFRFRMTDDGTVNPPGWLAVQPERFLYAVEIAGLRSKVKMIIGNYLAAEVVLSS